MVHLLIAIIGSLGVLVLAAVAKIPTYRVAPLFLIPLIWIGYWLRKRFYLHPAHYALLVGAILLHDVGAFGFYQESPLPFSFDILVHSFFGFAATFAVYRLLEHAFPFRRWQTNLFTLLTIMGCGALHEIMEYMSYLTLGEQRGMLKPTTSYFFDTQRDLTSNLVGVIVGLVVINLWKALSGGAERNRAG
ncbi:MAG TPA: DUF2238 domain-containing protein [Tepidisphaeraceae bacterium]|jgi:uncharacterized membrane protein YjdF